jgi:Flp pilus assembly pilin Flp
MFVRFRRLIKKASTTIEYGVVAAGIGLAIITIVDRLDTTLPQ